MGKYFSYKYVGVKNFSYQHIDLIWQLLTDNPWANK